MIKISHNTLRNSIPFLCLVVITVVIMIASNGATVKLRNLQYIANQSILLIVSGMGILFVMSDPINHQAVEYLWALWKIHVETYGGSVEEIESKHAVRVSLR